MDVTAHQQPGGNAPRSLVDWTQIIYGLHALSLVIGIIGTATVVGAFLLGWPSIIAVVVILCWGHVGNAERCPSPA